MGRRKVFPVGGVGGGDAGGWTRVRHADLTGLSGGALEDDETVTIDGVDWRFDLNGGGAAFTRVSGGIEITTVTAVAPNVSLFTTDMGVLDRFKAYAVLLGVASYSSLHPNTQILGALHHIDRSAAAFTRQGWQAGIRGATQGSARLITNTGALGVAVTFGTIPAAPLHLGSVVSPAMGVGLITGEGAATPASDPLAGATWRASSGGALLNFDAVHRAGVSAHMIGGTMLISSISVYERSLL